MRVCLASPTGPVKPNRELLMLAATLFVAIAFLIRRSAKRSPNQQRTFFKTARSASACRCDAREVQPQAPGPYGVLCTPGITKPHSSRPASYVWYTCPNTPDQLFEQANRRAARLIS